MKKQKNNLVLMKGFTLIELLIVIAIIGILAGVVLVSSGSGVSKANKASAITTLASVLPELVTCQDDGFNVNAYNTASKICNDVSHTVLWPDISKTGWTVNAPAASNANIATYVYTATKGSGATLETITCTFASNSCS